MGCPVDLKFLPYISITPENSWLHGADINPEKRIFRGGLMLTAQTQAKITVSVIPFQWFKSFGFVFFFVLEDKVISQNKVKKAFCDGRVLI